jgi:hypothetical protein
MLKATQLTFAAALLAASCGYAMAQAGGGAAGAGSDKTPGSDQGPGRLPLLRSPQATSAPEANRLRAKNTNLGAKRKTGKAKHVLSPSGMRQQTR